jgi:hypothetical protein
LMGMVERAGLFLRAHDVFQRMCLPVVT